MRQRSGAAINFFRFRYGLSVCTICQLGTDGVGQVLPFITSPVFVLQLPPFSLFLDHAPLISCHSEISMPSFPQKKPWKLFEFTQ